MPPATKPQSLIPAGATVSLSDLLSPVNILYTGDGGTGKTTHACAMANLGRIVAVNGESGIKARALRARGINTDNIEVFPRPGEDITYETLEGLWLRIREDLHADPQSWAGVVWDPVSEIQNRLVAIDAAKSVLKASNAGRDRDQFVRDRDNWNTANEQLRQLIRKFRDLPCHFAMTALMRREKDDDGAVIYHPNVTPSMQNDVYGWMDLVCVTSVAVVDGEEEYRGLFRPHGKYRGKEREGGAVPKWVVNPTFDRILQYDEEVLTVDTDPVMVAARERDLRAAQKQAALVTATAAG